MNKLNEKVRGVLKIKEYFPTAPAKVSKKKLEEENWSS
jgi:hypothetical protein